MTANPIWQSAQRYAAQADACEACRVLAVVHAVSALEAALHALQAQGAYYCRAAGFGRHVQASHHRGVLWLDYPRVRSILAVRNAAIHRARPVLARDAREIVGVIGAQLEAWEV